MIDNIFLIFVALIIVWILSVRSTSKRESLIRDALSLTDKQKHYLRMVVIQKKDQLPDDKKLLQNLVDEGYLCLFDHGVLVLDRKGEFR